MTVITHRLPTQLARGLRALIKEARERQRRRRMLLALLLIVAAGAVGIGYEISDAVSGSRSAASCAASQCASLGTPTSRVPNPCTLLTNAEAATALGTSIQYRSAQLPPSMPTTSHYRMCTWKGAPLSSFGFSDNTVVIWIWPSTRKQFEKTARATKDAIVIRDLGEAAYAINGPARLLYVLQRGYVLQVQAVAVNPLQTDKKLAELALTRLR